MIFKLQPFQSDQRGATAVVVALSSVVLIGAVGLGIDVARVQNAQIATQRIADATCARVTAASFSGYPATSDVVNMAQSFLSDELGTNGATDGASGAKGSLTYANTTSLIENYALTINQTVPATFGSVVGYQGTPITISQICNRAQDPTNTNLVTSKCTQEDQENYIKIAGFPPKSPPGPYSLTDLQNSSNQSSAQGFVATIIDNSNAQILLQTQFDGAYTYQAPSSPTKAMTLVIQDMNADGSTPQFCVKPVPPPPPPHPAAPPPTSIPPSCDLSTGQYDHDTITTRAENAKYWGSLKVSPNTNSTISKTSPGYFTISGLSQPGYKSQKVAISPWFTPNTTTKVSVSTGSSNFTASGEDGYFYNLVMNQFSSTVSDDGTTVGEGASKAGLNGDWRLVHIIDAHMAIWEDNSSHTCFELTSPIAIDLPGLGQIATTGISTAPDAARPVVGRLVSFDFGEGETHHVEWLTGNGQGFLVDNRDGQAAEHMSMDRLFGVGDDFANGYAKLATFDHSGTGILRGHDLDGLAVWIDNGDGMAKPDEIVPLAKLGITEISTRFHWVKDEEGHNHMRSSALRGDESVMTEDIWLARKR